MNLDRELQSLGFVSDPQRGKPLKIQPIRRCKHDKDYDRAYNAKYRKARREHWLALGIVKPRTPEEFALTQAANAPTEIAPLQRVGSGPLAIWIPFNGNVAVPAVSTTTQESVPTVPQTEAATLPLIQRAA